MAITAGTERGDGTGTLVARTQLERRYQEAGESVWMSSAAADDLSLDEVAKMLGWPPRKPESSPDPHSNGAPR
jgi:hypothetical protein